MKFIKRLTESNNVRESRTRIYENVVFIDRFGAFLAALSFDKLTGEETTTVALTEAGKKQWQWCDARKDAGVQVITSEHPLITTTPLTLTVSGKPHALDVFESILKRYATVGIVEEVEPYNVEIAHRYHQRLNPKFWDENNQLKDDVKEKLLQAANEFYEFLKVDELDLEDVILTGSNANYNWTNQSDLDLHIVFDFKKAEELYGSIVGEYFEAKKKVWNDFHDIKIRGQEVEFYVQDKSEPHISTGIYSLLDDEWEIKPRHEEPKVNDMAVKTKAAAIMNQIDQVVSDCNKAAEVEHLMSKLKKMRQTGLSREGEFSTENLVFKTLRNTGYLEKLASCKTKAFDRELSIEDEEWNF